MVNGALGGIRSEPDNAVRLSSGKAVGEDSAGAAPAFVVGGSREDVAPSIAIEAPAAPSEKTWPDIVTGGPPGITVPSEAVIPEMPPVKGILAKIYTF